MTVLTLEQFEQLIKTNVLTDPPMWVRNASFPRGQVSFNVLGSDFRMRDVIVPVSGQAIDLTLFAPLQNLLASAELRAVFASGNLKLINPDDMPEPVDPIAPFPEGSISVDPPVYTEATAITGDAPTGTQVQIVMSEKIVAVIAENNRFSIPANALEVGNLEVTFIKDGFKTQSLLVAVTEKPLQPYPQPTVSDYTYFDPTLSGTTVAGATVVLKNDGSVSDSVVSGSDGAFSLDVPQPHGTLEIVFNAPGYVEDSITIEPKDREVNVTPNTPKYLDEEITLAVNPVQPVAVQVEIEIDGQPLITKSIPQNEAELKVPCSAIKGNVKVTVKSTGYAEFTISSTPDKNTFGAVSVSSVHAEENSVSGTVAEIRNADDVSVELVTQEKTYNANVLSDGSFSVPTDALNAGSASLKFTSNYFESKTQNFEVALKEIPAPTVNEVYEGETSINGTTLEGVKVSLGDKSIVASAGGAFSLSVDPLSSGNVDVVFSKTNYSDKTVSVAVKPLSIQAEPTAQTVYIGETDINGSAEPDAEIYIDGNKVGDVESDGSFGLTGPAMNSAETLTFKKLHYSDKTLVVTPQPLSNFSQPALTVEEGDTEISGVTESNTLVSSVSANTSVTSNGTGAFTLALKEAAVVGAKIEIGFSKRGFANSSFEYTVAAKNPE